MGNLESRNPRDSREFSNPESYGIRNFEKFVIFLICWNFGIRNSEFREICDNLKILESWNPRDSLEFWYPEFLEICDFLEIV